MATGDLITQKEAAVILNRSVSAVSRAIKDGRLAYADPERRLLHRPGLEMKFRQTTRPRIDAPQRKAQMEAAHRDFQSDAVGLEATPIATTYWERLDQKLQWVLEGAPAYWSEAPDPQRLRLFCRTLDELMSQCAAEGLEPSILTKGR